MIWDILQLKLSNRNCASKCSKNYKPQPNDTTALAAFDQPSAHNQIRAMKVRKLEMLSGTRWNGSTGISDIHRFGGPSFNVRTMHESGQADPSGAEDKRQSWIVVTTDWYTASNDTVSIVWLSRIPDPPQLQFECCWQ